MAGRYVGEMFVRVAGDRDAAPAYLPVARAVMGEALEQALFNGLGVHKVERRLLDGTRVVAEKIGDLNRVTIAPPPQGGRSRPVRVFDDLLVTAGADAFSGQERIRYPVILTPGDGWSAYFGGSGATGQDASTAARTGTYIDAFPGVDKHPDLLTDGGCYHHSEDGQVVSWVSGVVTLAPYGRHPRTLYGDHVVCLGHVLLSINQVIAASGYTNVMAAALVGKELLIVVAELDDLHFEARPAEPSRRFDVWSSPIYSDTAHPTALLRVKLREVEDPVSQQLYYKPVYTQDDDIDAEVLWAGTLVRGYNRWTYTPDGVFVSVQLPEQPLLKFDRGELVAPLSSNEVIFTLGPSGLSTAPAGNVVTFDPAGEPVSLVGGGRTFEWVCGPIRLPAYSLTDTELIQSSLEFVDAANNRAITFTRWERIEENDLVYSGYYYTAFDQGASSEYAATQGPTHSAYQMTPRVWDGVNQKLTGSGIAIAAHAVYGAVIVPENPDEDEDGLYGGMISPPQMAPAALHVARAGYSVGGASGNFEYNFGDLRWDTTEGFAPENDVAFTPSPVLISAVYVSGGFAAGEGYLAASARRRDRQTGNLYFARYITDGQLSGLTGGAFPESMFFTPLGKPLLAQPWSTPA